MTFNQGVTGSRPARPADKVISKESWIYTQDVPEMFSAGIKLADNGNLQIVNSNRFTNVCKACGVHRQ